MHRPLSAKQGPTMRDVLRTTATKQETTMPAMHRPTVPLPVPPSVPNAAPAGPPGPPGGGPVRLSLAASPGPRAGSLSRVAKIRESVSRGG